MEGKYSVYIIKCKEGKFYIGLSSDVEKRIDAHNKGLSIWTSKYSGWIKVYERLFENYSEARKWEIYLKKQKSGNGFRKIIAESMGS
jgi:putative endonuclease